MALRLLEVSFSSSSVASVETLLADFKQYPCWRLDNHSDGQIVLKVLMPAEETERLMDVLEKGLLSDKSFKLVLLPVHAAVPRFEEKAEKALTKERDEARRSRVSREELHNSAMEATSLSSVYFVMVVLSSIVASIGLLKANLAVIIGAMVIAPLLGPNVALSLSATLGDVALAGRSIRINLAGFGTALAVAAVIGLILPVDTANHEIASRAVIGLDDIVLAFVAGCAGALAFTTGVPATLIGVMVAVSLLPPLAVFGLLLGSQHLDMAWNALLLLSANVICVNLAGVLTFLVQGLRPLGWRESGRAKKTTFFAIVLWAALLAALTVVVLISKREQI